jgi:hypothetical protein
VTGQAGRPVPVSRTARAVARPDRAPPGDRGWQAHNHGAAARANLGDADIGDEILLLPADGHNLTILRPKLRGAERQATNEQ